jgi:HAD superfamily hydrolase (TIGR01509 family)
VSKLIIFDCDGVLVDSEKLANAVESEHLARINIALTPDEARAHFKGKTIVDVVNIVQERFDRKLAPEWLHDLGVWTALALVRFLKPVTGVRPLLERLHAAQIPICVASQSSLPRVQLSLLVTGLDGYFAGRIFCASMVERPKPAPDLFLHAAAQMQVDPQQCIVIEDSPSGVVAAKDAGMQVLGYACDAEATALRNAGAEVFQSMQELPALLHARGIEVGG